MPRPLTPLVISQFVGMNDTTPASEIEENQGSYIQNMYIVNGGLERRLGSALISNSVSSHFVQGLMWGRLPASGAVERVFGVSQGKLLDFYGGGVVGAPVDLGGGVNLVCSSQTNLVGMAIIDNVLYAGDGTDPMARYNGTNLRKSGSSAPTSAPTFNAFVAAGVLTGNVTYKVVYLDADGHESEASAASATFAPVGQNVTINLPNDVDADRSGKNVYRRGTSSTAYRLVNASPISATATTYTDSTADADLGDELVTGQTLFPAASRLWEHDNRLFGCGNASDPRTLYISNEFEPWYCPDSPDLDDPTQGLRLRVQARNATIVGGISHGGYCFVFTDEGGYIMQGTSQDDYRLERFTNHGCASHYSIKSVRNWLFWVGPDGIYRYDGEKVERIDDSIRTYFLLRSAANLALVCAWVYDDRYYVSFPTGQNAVKCFDTRYEPKDGWTTLRFASVWRTATVSTSQGANPGVPRVFVADNGNQSVMQLEKPATFTDARATGSGTDDILISWISKMWNMGQFGRDKRVHLWGAKLRNPASGSGTITLNLWIDGESTASNVNAIQVASATLSSTSSGDDWSETITTPTITISRNEATEKARSEYFQMQISGGTNWSDFRIVEAELYWTLAG